MSFNFDDFKLFVRRQADEGNLIDHSGWSGKSAWCGCAIGLHFESISPKAAYVELNGYEYNDYAQSVEDFFDDQPADVREFAWDGYGYESIFELLNESSPPSYAELDAIITSQYGD